MKLESNDYFHAMDRNKDIDAIGNLGVSTSISQNQLRELQAKILKGAGAVELGFMGRGKGNLGQGAGTPGSYGKAEREAMHDLAKINDVKLSVHASTGVGSWSGLSQNQFDENSREQNIMEGKRTIEFAADVAKGGPIVVHTGEYPRQIADTKDKKLFEGFPTESSKDVDGKFVAGQKMHYLIDKRTGKIITGIREDQVNHIPAYEKEEHTDKWGQKYNHVKWSKGKSGGKLDVEQRDWKYYVNEAKKKNMKPEYAAVLFHKDQLETQIAHSRGNAGEYEWTYHNSKRLLDSIPHLRDEELPKLKKEMDILEQEMNNNIQDKEKLELLAYTAGKKKEKIKEAKELIARERELEKRMGYGRETAASARAQEATAIHQRDSVDLLSNYALEKTADSIARMALYAKEVQETNPNVERDLFVAPENIWPEMGYGSHPDELRNIIVKSRKAMQDKLVEGSPGMTQEKAKDIAAKHIKATFDIGHAHTWKKYFKRNDGESFEDHHNRFTKWLMGKVEGLHEEKILGHVHITDNFGYYDEHISPGQGNVPVKEFMDKLKDLGYTDQVTIESAQQDYQALTEMWRLANSPIYKIDSSSLGWVDVQNGYFGQTQSPNFLFGPTAPDPRTWTTWSEVPME
jgi:hypothetical protein